MDAMLACLETSGAAAAGGALLESDGGLREGSLSAAFRHSPACCSKCCSSTSRGREPGEPALPLPRRRLLPKRQEVEQPAGACLAVTRTAWDRLLRHGCGVLSGLVRRCGPLCPRFGRRAQKIVYCPAARFRHSGAHSVGQLHVRDKQMFWYGNMVRYARKHFSAESVVICGSAIVVGMGLRMLASLFGGRTARMCRGLMLSGLCARGALAIGARTENGEASTLSSP